MYVGPSVRNGSYRRSMEWRMSADVMTWPFWSLMPSFSSKVQVLPPSEDLPGSVARSPTTVWLPLSSSVYVVRPR